jgi:EAL domain-containing protein (putative c-di-GMP-specific phosphodiesterase class I)
VIRRSARLIRALNENNSSIRSVAVNLSGHQIADSSFPKSVMSLCKQEGIIPSSLSFEVTESVWVRNNSALLMLSKAFKTHGITLALDDFGTGYANLEAVYSGIFETVKFDGKLFRNLSSGPAGHDTLSNLIALFSSLGVKTTIEGVESEEQRRDAIHAKADSLQGFLVRRPLQDIEIIKL